jgi:hypothetical protein
MHRLNLVANSARMHLLGIAGWLSGCSHRRKTFPFTPRSTVSANQQPGTRVETYVVCLDCGRKLAYDWTRMCITPKRPRGLEPGIAVSIGRAS